MTLFKPRRLPALAFALLLAMLSPSAAREGSTFENPCFERREWKVWRADEAPVEGVQTLVKEGKETKAVETVLAPPAEKDRVYPVEAEGRFLAYAPSPRPSPTCAGIWDDVYTSWSGLHGYVRPRWKGPGGDSADVLQHIIHFVDVTKQNTLRAGVNFIHQSTTGCCHSITNGYMPGRTEQFERLYFADCLFTAPAHASWTEQVPDRTTDLVLALFPTIFNSVGSSNSETMAITKMILAGGYLPPETKRRLKENGLYPAAMLYLWKAGLPYPVPYDHELRHRVAYKAIGNRFTYPEKYGAAGIERGDLCLEFHQYDDAAHMRNMIELARSMDSPLPEAVLKVVEIHGGRTVYSLKKAMLVVQEPGEEVRILVSTEDCYDLDDRPLAMRFKLLCGTKGTTVERQGESDRYLVTVPWDGDLPQGRTTVALIANNGAFDSNPAAINVYRKRGEIPGNGLGPGDYKYPGKFANLRPVLIGLTDRVVEPGEVVRIPVDARDPEGSPVRFYRRSGEPGEFDGNLFTWTCPKDSKPGTYPVTVIASDGTSGASYAGETLNLEVAPKVFAKLSADRLTGPAPLTVEVSAEGSFDVGGKLELGWEFYAPTAKHKEVPFKDQAHDLKAKHEFEKPGTYAIALTVKGPSGTDTEVVSVLATAGPLSNRPPGLAVEGNDAGIRNGDAEPCAFDHTHFGAVAGGASAEREFALFNTGDAALDLAASKPVTIEGPQAEEFSVVRAPRATVEGRGGTRFRIRFAPTGAGERRATVTIRRKDGDPFTFAVGGVGDIDQAALDRRAEPAFAAARRLFDKGDWEVAREKLRDFLEKWPGSSFAEEAAKLAEKIETDPEIRAAMEAARKARADAAAAAKHESAARSLWNLAENYRRNGRADLAEKTLRKLLAKYPDTTWAEKARKALEK